MTEIRSFCFVLTVRSFVPKKMLLKTINQTLSGLVSSYFFIFRFVEKSLEQSLRFRLCHPVNAQIESSKSCALLKIAEILPEDKRDRLANVMEMQHSEIIFDLVLMSHLSRFRPGNTNLSVCQRFRLKLVLRSKMVIFWVTFDHF